VFQVYLDSRAGEYCFHDSDPSISEFRTQINSEVLHLAVQDDGIVGFVAIFLPENFIHHLYVLPDCQGLGVARQLLAECQSLYGLPLSLKCLVANQKACDFYEKLYWKVQYRGEGRDGDYYQYCLGEGGAAR